MTRRYIPALCAALGLAIACGGSNTGAQPPSPGAAAPGGAGSAPSAAPGSPPGTRSNAPGSAPSSCDFRVGETCYATDTEACAAAGCKPGSCIVLESYPAQISCK